jgi:hypothetical protein
MPIDDALEQMKQEAVELGRYYYKGFGNTFNGIVANAGLYLEEPDRIELSARSHKWLDKIDTHYRMIPFSELHGRENFYPLFIVHRLLPKFRTTMDKVFEAQDNENLRNLVTDAGSIVNVGRLYWDSFHGLLHEIRSHPESQDFRVRIVDDLNRVWHF